MTYIDDLGGNIIVMRGPLSHICLLVLDSYIGKNDELTESLGKYRGENYLGGSMMMSFFIDKQGKIFLKVMCY